VGGGKYDDFEAAILGATRGIVVGGNRMKLGISGRGQAFRRQSILHHQCANHLRGPRG
jgi:hypothetical protein